MPATGIEPVWEYKSRRILSPVRLPVPPHRLGVLLIIAIIMIAATRMGFEPTTSAVTGRRYVVHHDSLLPADSTYAVNEV